MENEKGMYSRGTGIIIGHGRQLSNELCRIPDNILLKPTSRMESCADLFEGVSDFLDLYKSREYRGLIQEWTDDYEGRYMPGSLIPNLIIDFCTTFPVDTPRPHNYSNTGIITGNITCVDDDITCLYPEITDTQHTNDDLLMDASMKFHDNDIIDSKSIWRKTVKLSDILTLLSVKITELDIPQVYILHVCRVHDEDIKTLSKLSTLKEALCKFDCINPESLTLSRLASTSERTEFTNFEENLVEFKQLITDPIFLDEFYSYNMCTSCNGPRKYVCSNEICLELCSSIHSVLNRFIFDIEEKLKGNVITYNDFASFDLLRNGHITNEIYDQIILECTKVSSVGSR